MAIHPSPLQRERLGETATGPIALVQFVRPSFADAYDDWLAASDEAVRWTGGRRAFALSVDDVLTSGAPGYTRLVIDTFPSPIAAGRALDTTADAREKGMAESEVLVVRGGRMSGLGRMKGLGPLLDRFQRAPKPEQSDSAGSGGDSGGDSGGEPEQPRPDLAPSASGIDGFLQMDPSEPVFIMHLNRYYPRAHYPDGDRGRTGKQAHARHRWFAVPRMVRLGAYPAFDGSVIGTVVGDATDPIFDTWNYFELVSYPRRESFISYIGSPAIRKGTPHRNAALERTVLMACSGD